ncbi:MAG: helix-turn-helix domain-containing protein [Candidatus Marithrix sp.]
MQPIKIYWQIFKLGSLEKTYRINTIEIKLPALREREQDILLLAKFFLRKFVEKEGKDFQEFSTEAKQQLLSYDWPGNVRQLQNTIHNLVVLNTGKVITNDMITAKLGEKTIPNIQSKNMVSTNNTSDIITVNRFCHFKEIEKEVLLKGIEYCDGNVTQAAKLFGISKATLFNKLKLYKNAG